MGRAPKEFVPDYSCDVAAEFQLWLEHVNDYMALCKIDRVEEKNSLFMNLAGLSLRRIIKGLVVPAPTDATDTDPGDTYKALTDTVLAHFDLLLTRPRKDTNLGS